MGVQEPVEDVFTEVPATPPGVQDIGSDDDLFAQVDEDKTPKLTTMKNDLFKGIFPVLPYKGNFDFIEDEKDLWGLKSFTTKKKDKQCPTCLEDATRDLKKLEQFVQKCKNETDDLRAENERLKKEVEELKKYLKNNDSDKNIVEISISDQSESKFDVLMRKNNLKNYTVHKNKSDLTNANKLLTEKKNNFGIQSLSISLPKEDIRPHQTNADLTNVEPRIRKSVAQLRKEFFEREFKSEQKSFKSENFLEIKPEVKKDTFRSRLNIKISPKPRIAEVISKLTSFSTGSKRVPEAAPIAMFQSFEKSRLIWQNDVKEILFLKINK